MNIIISICIVAWLHEFDAAGGLSSTKSSFALEPNKQKVDAGGREKNKMMLKQVSPFRGELAIVTAKLLSNHIA